MQQTCAEVTQSATTIALAIIGAVGTGISAFIAYKLKVM